MLTRPALIHPIMIAIVTLLGASPLRERGEALPSVTRNLPDSMPPLARFLIGTWRCKGGTPSGKALAAVVRFVPALDGRWIQSEHDDIPPGKYHSLQMWSADATAKSLTTAIYDNFGGARRFTGRWGVDSIAWVRDTSEAATRFEAFTFRRETGDSYWYAWHVRRTVGEPIVLGDSATCRRSR